MKVLRPKLWPLYVKMRFKTTLASVRCRLNGHVWALANWEPGAWRFGENSCLRCSILKSAVDRKTSGK